MLQKSDTNLLHPALVNLTTQLFQDIIEHKINTPNFQCLGLQSIDYEQKENQIEVVLQFDIISSSSPLSSDDSFMNDSYTKCNYTDILIRSSNQSNREERKSPFVTIVVCCCILTTFFLLVMFLRCRSFIRRKQMAKRRNHSKYLYCSDYPKPRPINHSYIKTDKAYYWSPVKPSHKNSSSLWSEGLLKNNNHNNYNNCTSSSSSLNQSNHHMKKCQQHPFHSNGNYARNSYFTQRQCNSSNDIIHNYRNNININNNNNSYKQNCQHHKGIRESENYLAAGYAEYYKRMNNTSKLNMNKPNSVIGMYQNTQRIQKSTQNQSHPSPIRNQSVFFNSRKLPRENEITDSETPTTEFTGSSKSHQSTSQIHVYRKGRSLSPAEITNSSESKFLFNRKPRFSLDESDEMSDKPIQMNRPSEFHDVIIDCSSLESAVSYPVQNTFSHTNPSQHPQSPLETRTYQSLMSVYLNDVAQQTRNTVHTINNSITPNASDNSIVSRNHGNVNNSISNDNNNNNDNVSNHSICLDVNSNTSYQKDTLPYKLNIPKIATGVFNDELHRMEKVNSFESNQSSFSLNNDDSIEQNNNTSAAATAVLQGVQLPVVNEKPKRPVLCLFSANKSHRHYHSNRDHQKCHLRRDNSIRNDNMEHQDDDNEDGEEGEGDDINQIDNDMKQSLTSINTSMSKLPSINYTKRTSGSSSDINIDTVMNNSTINSSNNLLCKMNECKSCMNLQAYELTQDRYRNPSSGSTISQAPRSDLPDVYLNPPSMSTLQSQRSSLCERNRMEFLYVDNELERDNYSRHKLGTDKLISASHSEVDLTSMKQNNIHFSSEQTNGGGDNWSLVDELVILPQPQKFGLLHNQTFHLRNTYHQPLPQSPLNLAPPSFKFFQLPDDNFGNLPVKDKEHHISIQQHLRRALSLTYRRKSPRSVNAEIQSIMDKHYEMTGIRMTIGSGTTQKNTTTTKSYMNLFGSQFNTRIQSSRPRKRRCSWTFTKDITNEFQSGLKNVSSALHLDCTSFDLLHKIKQFREKPSVLESLSMTALPCLVPLRPRIRSDATNDMTAIDEEFIERRYHQKIHSDFIHPTKLSELKRNSMVAIDKSLSILGIQTHIRQVKSNLNLPNV
ncbi:unnamed protein product [Trichobilharzia szidati]|nr:unnamed protein product [Trichobilharzia szidati]CAH8825285.1 unnamed protein product [Trichobilharzia szidati]